MQPTSTTGLFFWGFLVAYGVLMVAFSPRAVTLGGFLMAKTVAAAAPAPG
jgi:hypothetical protein